MHPKTVKREKGKLNRNNEDRPRNDRDSYADLNKGILVSNLKGKLVKMGENDIREMFSAFGVVENVEIEIDPYTQNNKGVAIVRFNRSEDAREAIRKMDGFYISGEPLRITKLPHHMNSGLSGYDDGKANISSNTARFELMRKLAGKNGEVQKEQDNSSIEIIGELRRNVKKERYATGEMTRTLGLFNIVDKNKFKEENGKDYIDDIISTIEGKLKRNM